METNEVAPEGNIRTVGCSISKLILNEDHLQSIRDVVLSTHKATILVSELLNIHIRRMLEEDPESDLQCCFHPNWLSQAYNGVTKAGRRSTTKMDTCHTCDSGCCFVNTCHMSSRDAPIAYAFFLPTTSIL